MGHAILILVGLIVGFFVYLFTGNSNAAVAAGGGIVALGEANKLCVKLTGQPLWEYGWQKLNKILLNSYTYIVRWIGENKSFAARAVLVVAGGIDSVRRAINLKFIAVNEKNERKVIIEEYVSEEDLKKLDFQQNSSMTLNVDELKV